MGKRQQQSGAVLVEFALVLPLLLTAIIGGFSVASSAYARYALQAATRQAARELSLNPHIYGIDASMTPSTGQAYWYNDFTETYGLDRSSVKMVVAFSTLSGSGQRIVATAACWGQPVPVPNFRPKPPPPPGYWESQANDASNEVNDAVNQTNDTVTDYANRYGQYLPPGWRDQATSVIGQVQQAGPTIANAEAQIQYRARQADNLQQLWDRAGDLISRGQVLVDRFQGLMNEANFQEFIALNQGVQNGSDLEAVARKQCRGALVVSARAAFLAPTRGTLEGERK